jgi:hypothetical protein
MTVTPCPKCHKTNSRLLKSTSTAARVHYWICDHCGHFWTVPKDEAPTVFIARRPAAAVGRWSPPPRWSS